MHHSCTGTSKAFSNSEFAGDGELALHPSACMSQRVGHRPFADACATRAKSSLFEIPPELRSLALLRMLFRRKVRHW
jgi:hypothetical protein